jgi:hypothetical protein
MAIAIAGVVSALQAEAGTAHLLPDAAEGLGRGAGSSFPS